jgi:hypothetical protein
MFSMMSCDLSKFLLALWFQSEFLETEVLLPHVRVRFIQKACGGAVVIRTFSSMSQETLPSTYHVSAEAAPRVAPPFLLKLYALSL